MEVFPNPASDYFIVKCAETLNGVQVTDLSGRVLRDFSLLGELNTTSFPVSDLKNGVYLLKLKAGNTVEVSNLFVKK
jgi:hypothetical protein